MRWIMVAVAIASSPAYADGPWTALGDEIVERVNTSFYDAPRAQAWAAKHRGYGKAIRDADGFTAATRAALDELEASHTGYLPRASQDHAALRSIFKLPRLPGTASIGADIGELAGGWFVRHVFPGSPAERAGLLRGDRIVDVGGRPFDPVKSLAGHAGERLKFHVEREAGKPPLELAIAPREIEPRTEWLDAQRESTKIVTRGAKRIGYQYLFSCAGWEYQLALADAIEGPFADVDALVVDFRDGWGGCQPSFVGLFDAAVPMMSFTSRGKRKPIVQAWRKPVVVLVNHRTRSGKEIVSHALRAHRRATIVGEHTAGAVLGGHVFALSNGDVLFLAVADVDLDGIRLEGIGVSPDVEVRDDLRFAAGRDPQLERALDVAAK